MIWRRLLFIALVVISLTAYWLGGTGHGLRTLAGWLPEDVDVQVEGGTLLGGFTLAGFRMQIPGFRIRVDRADIDWSPGQLLRGHLDITSLALSGFVLVQDQSVPDPGTSEPSYAGLPFSFSLRQLDVQDITLQRGTAEYRLDNIRLAAAGHTDRIEVSMLTLAGMDITASATGTVSLQASPVVTATIQWRYHPQALPEIAGLTRMDGNPDQINLATDFSAPAAASATLQISDPAGALVWQLDGSVPAIDSSRFSSAIAPVTASLSLNGSGSRNDAVFQSDLTTTPTPRAQTGLPELRDASLSLDITLPDLSAGLDGATARLDWTRLNLALPVQDIQLDSREASWDIALIGDVLQIEGAAALRINDRLDTDLRLRGRVTDEVYVLDMLELASENGRVAGEARYSRDNSFAARFTWDRLQLPVTERLLVLNDGLFTIDGTTSAYELALETGLSGSNLPSTVLHTEGSGNPESLTLTPLRLDLFAGEINGQADIRLAGTPSVTIDLAGVDLNPGTDYPDWEGKLSFESRASWAGDASQIGLHIESFAGRGVLRGYPVAAEMAGFLAADNYRIDTARLISGVNTLTLAGTSADLEWTIQAPDLSELGPDWAGALEGRGGLEGETRELQVTLQAHDIVTEQFTVDESRLEVEGTLEDHRFRLQVENPQGTVALTGTGRYQETNWQGLLQEARVETRLLPGNWVNPTPVEIGISPTRLTLDNACLTHDHSRLCIQGEAQPGGTTELTLSARELELADLMAQRIPDLMASGQLDVDLMLRTGDDSGLRGTTSLTIADLTLNVPAGQENRRLFPLGKMSGEFTLSDQHLQGRVGLEQTDLAALDARFDISPWTDLIPDPSELSVAARVTGQLPDLSLLTQLTPAVTEVSGRLAMDLDLSGPLQTPQVRGRLGLEEGSLMLPDMGIELNEIVLRGESGPDQDYLLHLNARSGPGDVSLETSLNLRAESEPLITTRLQGTRFEAVNLPEIQALSSPDLTLHYGATGMALKGVIQIPAAEIDLDEIRPGVSLSEDVMIEGSGTPKSARLTGNREIVVRIVLGDEIHISGQGISGQLSGQLDIHSGARGELLANGEITVLDGEFSAYGQNLLIPQGSLIYTNRPLDNPELRVRAQRRINADLTVGLDIGGTLQTPDITLFSVPTLADQEILSYIVFGRPLTGLTSGEGTSLIGAATAIGVRNSRLLTRGLSDTFGLDALDVQSDADGANASLTVGKYLTPKLYLSYVVGLMESLSVARIRYELSRRWSLEASSGQNTEVDIYYSLEKYNINN